MPDFHAFFRDQQFVLDGLHDVNDALLGMRVDGHEDDLALLDYLRAAEDLQRGICSFASWGLARLGELIAKVEG